MPFDSYASLEVGRKGVRVTRLGFGTAPLYGFGLAEERLGRVLSGPAPGCLRPVEQRQLPRHE